MDFFQNISRTKKNPEQFKVFKEFQNHWAPWNYIWNYMHPTVFFTPPSPLPLPPKLRVPPSYLENSPTPSPQVKPNLKPSSSPQLVLVGEEAMRGDTKVHTMEASEHHNPWEIWMKFLISSGYLSTCKKYKWSSSYIRRNMLSKNLVI